MGKTVSIDLAANKGDQELIDVLLKARMFERLFLCSYKSISDKISLVLFKCIGNNHMSCQRYSNMVKCL